MAYGKKPSGKAKPANSPFGPATGGTEMVSGNRNRMSSKQEKEWAATKRAEKIAMEIRRTRTKSR
jgi:hypothetical protein